MVPMVMVLDARPLPNTRALSTLLNATPFPDRGGETSTPKLKKKKKMFPTFPKDFHRPAGRDGTGGGEVRAEWREEVEI